MNHVDKRPQLSLSAGTIVAGKYRIERTLAEGGMGVVVAATHLHLQQSVALKFIRAGEIDANWDALARFSAEAKAVAQLKGEHVAHVLDAGVTEDGVPYMVMEYLEGRSLGRTIQTQGPLDVAQAAEYVIQACEGIAEAHACGIVHRDIKPYNLFLVERSPGWHSIKIIDFGISKFAFSDNPNVVTGVIIGSPCYMSPEQLRSTAEVDHRSDIWSLGATLHEILAGRAAFDSSQTLPELVAAILDKPAPALCDLRPDVPEALAAVVARCLAKDRNARFQNAGQVAMALLPFASPHARVTAERAASMKPAFYERPAPADGAMPRAGAPVVNDAPPTKFPSLTPVITDASGPGDGGSPLFLVPVTSEGDAMNDKDGGIEVAPRRTPKWLVVATFGGAAVLLFVAILIAAADNGGKQKSPLNSAPPSVAALALTRPEAPPPTVSLAPMEPPAPQLVQLVVRASPAFARITVDGAPVNGNPFHSPYAKGGETHRITASANGYDSKSEDVVLATDVVVDLSLTRQATWPASPATVAPEGAAARQVAPRGPPTPLHAATRAPIASTGGEVDSSGGRAPLRPIETKDPYGSQ